MNPSKGVYPEDTSGTAIQGGETYHLSKGDVIIVPNGVPHWFKEAHGFRYFLVRIQHSEREALNRQPKPGTDEGVGSVKLEKTAHLLEEPHGQSKVEMNAFLGPLSVHAVHILKSGSEANRSAVEFRSLGARF